MSTAVDAEQAVVLPAAGGGDVTAVDLVSTTDNPVGAVEKRSHVPSSAEPARPPPPTPDTADVEPLSFAISAAQSGEVDADGINTHGHVCNTHMVTDVEPRAIFLRLVSLNYFIAFYSLSVQFAGLYGSAGIFPIGDVLKNSNAAEKSFAQLPALLKYHDSLFGMDAETAAHWSLVLGLLLSRYAATAAAICY